MSYYPPPVTPGAQPNATNATTATTATYSYGSYPSYYYQWPPYNLAVPSRPQSTVAQIPTSTQTTATIPTASSSTQRPAYTPYTSTYTKENTSTSAGRGSRKQSNIKGLFTKELRNLMYGFGDDRNPANDTVNVMEEILVEYITDVCQAATGPGRKSRLSIEDLRKALSRPADAKKLARMEELLFAQEDIKRARQQFETDPKMA